MPLTSAEVRAVQFGTTRLRSGYDMDEVDSFLDIIEADIGQLTDELQRSRDGEAVLRTQCDQLQSRLAAAEQRLAAEPTLNPSTQARERAVEITAELQAVLAEHPDAAQVVSAAERTAEEIVRAAQQQADAIRASVRSMLDAQRALLGS